MVKGAGVIVGNGTELPVVIFLRRFSRTCSYIKCTVRIQCVATSTAGHYVTVQVIPLHTEIEETIPVIIEFLFMVVYSQPPMGRFHHAIKAVIVGSLRNLRKSGSIGNAVAKDEPAEPILDIQISIPNEEVILGLFRGVVNIGKNALAIDLGSLYRCTSIDILSGNPDTPFFVIPKTLAPVQIFTKNPRPEMVWV